MYVCMLRMVRQTLSVCRRRRRRRLKGARARVRFIYALHYYVSRRRERLMARGTFA